MKKLIYSLLFTIVCINRAPMNCDEFFNKIMSCMSGSPIVDTTAPEVITALDNSPVENVGEFIEIQCIWMSGTKVGPVKEFIPEDFIYKARNNPSGLFFEITGEFLPPGRKPAFAIVEENLRPGKINEINVVNVTRFAAKDYELGSELPRLFVSDREGGSEVLDFYNPAEAFYAFPMETPYSPSLIIQHKIDDTKRIQIGFIQNVIKCLSNLKNHDKLEKALRIAYFPGPHNASFDINKIMVDILTILLIKEDLMLSGFFDISTYIDKVKQYIQKSHLSPEEKKEKIDDFDEFLQLLDADLLQI